MEIFLGVFFIFSLSVVIISNVQLRRERRTLRKQLRHTLEAASDHIETQQNELGWYHRLCELYPFPIFVTDNDKQLVYANHASRAEFGELVIGEAAIRGLRNHHLESLLDEALHNERTEPQTISWQKKHFFVRVDTWGDTNGEKAGAIMLMQDVTELKRLARARRDMASNLSHELRTPLASIKLMAETLLHGALEQPKFGKRLVMRMASENDAMIRLIEDLTALSWIESQRVPLRLERINLSLLAQQRIDRLALQQELKELQIQLFSPPEPIIELDSERFGQVLTNLLDNAIKFSPKGGQIKVVIDENEEAITLSVRDNGPGIIPTDLPRIFERFYKGDQARTRSNKAGTGLGLAIVKHLVEAHNGSIKAENNQDGGATFTITLFK